MIFQGWPTREAESSNAIACSPRVAGTSSARCSEGQGTFYEFDHYPAGDVHDPETHCQHYYHSHRSGEHGHFHVFLREQGMPEGLRPIEQSHAPFMDERDDTLCHLIAISMNPCRFSHRAVHHQSLGDG